MPRPAALAASGFEVESLVASGMLLPADEGEAKESTLSAEDVAALRSLAADYRAGEERRARERSVERVRRLASTLNEKSSVKRIKLPSNRS